MAKAKRVVRSFQDEAKKEIAKTLDRLSGRYSRWEIWNDFVTMGAISISNAVDSSHREAREQAYLDRAKKYRAEDLEALASMLATVIIGLDENPNQDFLGELYMGLDLGNDHAGQFFTPYNLCHFMAEMSAGDNLAAQIEREGWISVNDPCCGGGALLLAFANTCREHDINYQTSVLFAAQDLDPTVAMMCYIQMSLLGCAGYVKVGNSITDPLTGYGSNALFVKPGDNIWYTPMYFRDVWHYRRLWATMDMMIPRPTDTPDAAPDGAVAPGPAIVQPQTPEAINLRANEQGQFTLF